MKNFDRNASRVCLALAILALACMVFFIIAGVSAGSILSLGISALSLTITSFTFRTLARR